MLVYFKNYKAIVNLNTISTILMKKHYDCGCDFQYTKPDQMDLDLYTINNYISLSLTLTEKEALEILDKILTAKNNKQEILII